MRQCWVIVRRFLMQMYLHSFLFYLNENWHNSCNSQQKKNSWWSRSIFSNFPKMSVTVSSYREIDDSKCNLYHKTDQGTVIDSIFLIQFWNLRTNFWSLNFIIVCLPNISYPHTAWIDFENIERPCFIHSFVRFCVVFTLFLSNFPMNKTMTILLCNKMHSKWSPWNQNKEWFQLQRYHLNFIAM